MGCIYRLIRVFAFISLLFSIGVIIVNMWIFGSILYSERSQNGTLLTVEAEQLKMAKLSPVPAASETVDAEAKHQENDSTKIQFKKLNENKTVYNIIDASPGPGMTGNESHSLGIPDDRIVVIASAGADTGTSTGTGTGTGNGNGTGSETHYWAVLKTMTNTFKGIILGCTWLAILAGFIQFFSSAPLLFQISKRMPSVAGYTIGIHFISFIILLVCFLTPLTYNRDCFWPDPDTEDEQQEEPPVNSKCNQHLSWTEFKTLTKTEWGSMARNPIHFIRNDLNSYYVSIGVDIIILILNMFAVSLVLRCNNNYKNNNNNKSVGSKNYNVFP